MSNILLVDDSRSQILLNSKFVRDIIPEANIQSYSTPEEALEYFKGTTLVFDFALIDYNMVGMNGLELAHKLVELRPDLISFKKMALLTANVQDAVVEKAKKKGLIFISKPINGEKLQNFLSSIGVNYGNK